MRLDAEYFDARGPNPRTVRAAAAEKGIELHTTSVDVIGGENRQPEYLAINPFGGAPALRLSSGEVIADSLAICEYFEEIAPRPALLGTTSIERGIVRTWLRRIECEFTAPVTLGFRADAGRDLFAARTPVLNREASCGAFEIAQHALDAIERHMAGPFIAGDTVSLADIRLNALLDFAVRFGVRAPQGALAPWRLRMGRRQSSRA